MISYYFPVDKQQYPVMSQKKFQNIFAHFRAAARPGAWQTRWSSTTVDPATRGWS